MANHFDDVLLVEAHRFLPEGYAIVPIQTVKEHSRQAAALAECHKEIFKLRETLLSHTASTRAG